MPILHFSDAELKTRQLAARKAMQDLKLDGLLMFRQESMYYLTGYDTSGYTMFQGMLLTADGRSALLTRPIDRIQCLTTSIVEDLRIWVDSDDANPGIDRPKIQGGRSRLGRLLHACGCFRPCSGIASGQEPRRTQICAQGRRALRSDGRNQY
jgi:Xaa-Pro dipeptidase